MVGPGLAPVLVVHCATHTGVEWIDWLLSVASTSLSPCPDSVAYRRRAGGKGILCVTNTVVGIQVP